MASQIPDKLYFKIGEVAELTGVKPHVLRYWETEVSSIRPTKNRHQQRLYRQRDIELILRLKDLLYAQGYTIAGARKLLRRKPVVQQADPVAVLPADQLREVPPVPVADDGQMALPLGSGIDRRLLEELRRDLVRLRDSLSNAP
jgi:DNA-binding transcriptional MerR regulator